MNEEFSTALTLLAVGMITVFVILALIVFLGNALILITNKYFPANVKASIRSSEPDKISSKKIAAIVSAVDIVTKGKGKVHSIKKK